MQSALTLKKAKALAHKQLQRQLEDITNILEDLSSDYPHLEVRLGEAIRCIKDSASFDRLCYGQEREAELQTAP